jgi:hypothetical protein
VPPVENDSYVIEEDYVRIRRLRLILYGMAVWVVFTCGMGSIRVLSEMKNGIDSTRVTG